MPIVRVEKTSNYTTMSNVHLRDKNLTLSAKGLLSVALSLPDNWEYSLKGLVAISKENKTAMRSAIKVLKENGYLDINLKREENGKFGYEYVFYETPHKKSPCTDLPYTEVPYTEVPYTEVPYTEVPYTVNRPQLNTKELNTKELNTKGVSTKGVNAPAEKPREAKHKYGEYKHVALKDSEYEKLVEELGEPMRDECIKYLDEYIEMKGYKAKSHYLCIKRWVIDAVKEHKVKKKPNNKFNDFKQREYSQEFYDNLYDNKED